MIYYDNWENEYKEVIDRLFKVIAQENIAWISLGALRQPSYLDGIIRERHPESRIVYGELITGLDGKMRYFKKIRVLMFGKMYKWIHEHSENVYTYLCMESSEIYQQAFGWSPKTTSQLSRNMNNFII